MFQPGLRSAVGGAEPNHLATFRSASNEYSLAPGQDELVVTLDWVGEGPISARKTYTFRRGRYDVDLTLTVAPTPGGSWRGAPYVQMERVHVPVERSYLSVDSYSFKGPVLYDGGQIREARVRRPRADARRRRRSKAVGSRRSSTTSSRRPCRRATRRVIATTRRRAARRSC